MEFAKELSQVKDYYGRVLKGNHELKSGACCMDEALPDHHKRIIELIDDEVLTKFYGCGSPLPPALENAVVLDLGCGTGRDAFMASHLVGPNGRVIGIDMTEEQLEVARRHAPAQARAFGYLKSNVDFRSGYIEDLAGPGIADNSVDVVISNCVINLSPDKARVFSEIFRVLKPGGELYFSDVFADRRVPEAIREDPVLYGECLGGAMYGEDFRRMLLEVGVKDFRVVNQRAIELQDREVEVKAGMIKFSSVTVRAFKLGNLEDICEDYGQVATYRGSMAEYPHAFDLDDHHEFVTGKPMLVCGNTAAMVQDTRYARHFDVAGDCSKHYGPFDCTGDKTDDGESGSCC